MVLGGKKRMEFFTTLKNPAFSGRPRGRYGYIKIWWFVNRLQQEWPLKIGVWWIFETNLPRFIDFYYGKTHKYIIFAISFQNVVYPGSFVQKFTLR